MITSSDRIVLASSSPRRRELLGLLGVDFEVISPDISETLLPDERPEQMVSRLAIEKGEAVSAQYPNRWVLSADTCVVLEGEVFGKPVDRSHAFDMLSRMSGQVHQVIGGWSLQRKESETRIDGVVVTDVEFVRLRSADIERYVALDEPYDKAGAYAMQGKAAHFVRSVRGSITNVIGLDLPSVQAALVQAGILSS